MTLAARAGIGVRQPFAEQLRHLARQAQNHEARGRRSGIARRGEQPFDLVVVEAGNDRRHHHPHRTPRGRQRTDRRQPPSGCCGARFHPAGQRAVEGGQRDADMRKALAPHCAQDVRVAVDKRPPLGHHRHRVLERLQCLQHAAHDLQLLLDRLVGIGVGADGKRCRTVARARQLAGQQPGGVGLGEQPGLEVEAGREAEKGVARPREAIDAAVLAAAVRIDRAIERHVGRGVAGDDAARRVQRDLGSNRRGILVDLPAVVGRLARVPLEAAARVAARAATASGARGQDVRFVSHAARLEHY